MAKLVKYDNTGVEESGGGTGVKVPIGLRVAEIVSVTPRDTKSDGSPANDLQVILNFGEEYDWGYMYIGLSDAAKWKMAEFTRALNMKDKGQFDPDKLKGKLLRVKVNNGEYDGEYSPNFGKLFAPQPGDEVGQASFSSNGASGPDAEDYGTTDDSANDHGTPPPSTDADICREDPEDPEIGSYDDWPDEDIAAEVEARDLTLPGGRGSARNKGIKALREDDAAADAGDGDDAGEDPDSGDDDYDTWDLDQLQKEWEDRQMGELPSIRGRNRDERLKTAIIEELRKDDVENPFEG
jgi:hypothetical protein